MRLPAQARILVTGANGFVGRHLVARLEGLIEPDSEILLSDRGSHTSVLGERCRFVQLDITNISQVDTVIRDVQPTHIVHLAAIAAVTAADRNARQAWDVNFGGTLNLALALARFAPNCRVIYCSSAEIYGGSFASGVPLDEHAAIDPVNPYGAAKAAADIMLGQMARQSLRVIRLRPFNHTGPGQSAQFVVPSFANQIAQIERNERAPIIRVGDLQSRRDFLDIHDVIDAYVEALLRFDEIPSGTTINIASGQARSISDVLNDLLANSSVNIEIESDIKLFRASEIPVVVGNADLCRKLLQWKPTRPWTETLKSVLNYWRQQPTHL